MSKITSKVKLVNKDDLEINPATEETLQVVAGLNIPKYDYVVVTYPTTTSEVYTFKTGGAGGTTVAVVTIVYTDTTKDFISTVTKT